MVHILDAQTAEAMLPQFTAILRDAVENGASIGFVLPLSEAACTEYWRGVFKNVADGSIVLFAEVIEGELAGTAQLDLPWKPNGQHRAEVCKVIVHTRYRRRGIATRLLSAIEDHASSIGRYTLVLDTREGDHAEQVYRKHGYQRAGVVPQYARDPDSDHLAGTVFMYKLLKRV